MVVLNESDHYDSVTCSCVADVDCDGQHEVVLGTYGQVCETLLVEIKWLNIFIMSNSWKVE